MTNKAEDFGALDGADAPNAADLKARGAADRMWQKVEDDLDRIDNIDRGESGEANDG